MSSGEALTLKADTQEQVRLVEDFNGALESVGTMGNPAVWVDSSLRGRGSETNAPRYVGAVFNPDALLPILPKRFEASPPTNFSFQTQESRQVGAADSGHGVFFGDLHVYSGADEVAMVEVAVKPQERKPGKALNELKMLQLLEEKGFNTFVPVGVIHDQAKDSAYLITEYMGDENSIATLDNIGWYHYPHTPKFEQIVEPNLQFIADSMGELHGKKFFHGDAQVKNWAYDERGAGVVVDVEGMEKLIGKPEPDVMAKLASEDIATLFKSLAYKNFLPSTAPEYKRSVFESVFVEPYIDMLVETMEAEGYDDIVEDVVTGIMNTLGDDLYSFEPSIHKKGDVLFS